MAFRLAQLLRLRTVQQDTAAAASSVAAGRATAARSASAHRRAVLAETGFPAGGERAFAAAVAARGAMTARYAESLDLVLQADAEADHARAQLAAARARVKALERLELRHAQAEREESLRAEQAVLDERAGRRVVDTTIEAEVLS